MNFRSLTLSELLRYSDNYEPDNLLIQELIQKFTNEIEEFKSTIDDLKFNLNEEESHCHRLQEELINLKRTGTIPIYENEIAELEWQNKYLVKSIEKERMKRKLVEEKLEMWSILNKSF